MTRKRPGYVRSDTRTARRHGPRDGRTPRSRMAAGSQFSPRSQVGAYGNRHADRVRPVVELGTGRFPHSIGSFVGSPGRYSTGSPAPGRSQDRNGRPAVLERRRRHRARYHSHHQRERGIWPRPAACAATRHPAHQRWVTSIAAERHSVTTSRSPASWPAGWSLPPLTAIPTPSACRPRLVAARGATPPNYEQPESATLASDTRSLQPNTPAEPPAHIVDGVPPHAPRPNRPSEGRPATRVGRLTMPLDSRSSYHLCTWPSRRRRHDRLHADLAGSTGSPRPGSRLTCRRDRSGQEPPRGASVPGRRSRSAARGRDVRRGERLGPPCATPATGRGRRPHMARRRRRGDHDEVVAGADRVELALALSTLRSASASKRSGHSGGALTGRAHAAWSRGSLLSTAVRRPGRRRRGRLPRRRRPGRGARCVRGLDVAGVSLRVDRAYAHP